MDLRKGLVGAVLGLLVASGLGSPGEAAEAPCDDAVELEGVGPACPEGALWRLLLPDGTSVLTHGADAPPPEVPPVPQFSSVVPVHCVDPALPAVDHARNVLVYARAFDQADRFAQLVPQLRTMLLTANTWMFLDSVTRGLPVRYRAECDANLEPVVLNAVLPTPRAGTSPGTIFRDLRLGGFNNPDAKYMVWFDGRACGCGGIGTINNDDRLIPENRNNVGPDWGITFGYGGNTGAFIMMHENGHNQGAVQLSSPHSSGGWHCNDGRDIMCYADGGSTSNYSPNVCANTMFASHAPFDCNGDDYFNPVPLPDAYLFSHWNLASVHNRFVAVGV